LLPLLPPLLLPWLLRRLPHLRLLLVPQH